MTPDQVWQLARRFDPVIDSQLKRVLDTEPGVERGVYVEELEALNRAQRWLDDISTYVSGDARVQIPDWIAALAFDHYVSI